MDNLHGKKAYFLVIEHIKTLFQKGELSFGEKLPSERQLMATLGLGRKIWESWKAVRDRAISL